MDELSALLARFGYEKPLPKTKRLEGVEKYFVEWITNNLRECTRLTGVTKTRFDGMRRKGHCCNETEKQSTINELQQEIVVLVEEMQPLRDHLQTLNTVHTTMSCEYKDCIKEQERVTDCFTNFQKEYAATNSLIQTLNAKMNESHGQLQKRVDRVIQQSHTHQTTLTSLSSSSQLVYNQTESIYLKELTKYAKEQFSPGINEVMDNLSFNDNTVSVLDMTINGGRGQDEDAKIYERHKQEIDRLQEILPICEFQLVNNQIKLAYVKEAIKKGEENMKRCPKDTKDLSDAISFIQCNVLDIKQQLHQCNNDRLIPLIEDYTTLHVVHVIHREKDIKIAKQRLFISRQDEVIKFLHYQQSRYELLSILLEADFYHHRNDYQLLLATRGQLNIWHEGNKTKFDNFNKTRLADDSVRSKESENISQIVYKTDSSIVVKENASLSSVDRQQRLINTGISLYTDVRCHVYTSEDIANISFRPMVYQRSVNSLEKILGTLEEKIKTLLRDYDKKRKVLQHDPLLVTERNLFVHFFINPNHLVHLIAELTANIDSRILTINTLQANIPR